MPHRREEQPPEIIALLNSPMHRSMTIEEYIKFRSTWTELTQDVAEKLQKGWKKPNGK